MDFHDDLVKEARDEAAKNNKRMATARNAVLVGGLAWGLAAELFPVLDGWLWFALVIVIVAQIEVSLTWCRGSLAVLDARIERVEEHSLPRDR